MEKPSKLKLFFIFILGAVLSATAFMVSMQENTAWRSLAFGISFVFGFLFILFLYIKWKKTWLASAGLLGKKEEEEIWANKANENVLLGYCYGCIPLVSYFLTMFGLERFAKDDKIILISILGSIGSLMLSLVLLWVYLYSKPKAVE